MPVAKKVLVNQAMALTIQRMVFSHMDGVLNQNTKTVHRRSDENEALATACGLADHVDPDRLLTTSIELATLVQDADKCGGCFEEAGGY